MQALNSIEDLITVTLSELYANEQRQLQEFPNIIGAVQTPELKQAMQDHERETQQHLQRLDQIFQKMGQQPRSMDDPVIDALVEQAEEMIDAGGNPQVKEAALICEAQKFEHFEMAGYGSAAALAKVLGDNDTARMLKQTLEEEKRSDERLSQIAESQSNWKAAQA